MSSIATVARFATSPTTSGTRPSNWAGIPGRRIPHDFRRTAARAYRRAGVSEGVVMKVLGHRTRNMFERYNIKNEDDLREAAQAVELGRNGQVQTKVTVLPLAAGEKTQ